MYNAHVCAEALCMIRLGYVQRLYKPNALEQSGFGLGHTASCHLEDIPKFKIPSSYRPQHLNVRPINKP